MKLLLIYWSFLACGYIVGSKLRTAGKRFETLASFMMATVYCLCFVMGLRMGVNEQVTSNLSTIGLQALIITFCSIIGSMLFIFGMRKVLRMDRYGDRIDAKAGQAGVKAGRGTVEAARSGEAHDNAAAEKPSPADAEKEGLDVTSTLILLSVVAAGMLLGALVLAPRGEDFLAWFDGSSNLTMVVLLCILMSFVGLDMGGSGDVIRNLRTAGLRILVFPFATMAGTMVFGMGICLLMGFSLRESAAIPLGFGWYSYAPIVIAGAGQQYIVTSAVSFMHNVIREVTGIIMIPVVAKRFGYLEATGVPGIAAMDVCIPIVERSCRTDTVIYAFSTGLIMCFATSLGIPLVMGI